LHKLCAFRVANAALSLLFAFPRTERFTPRHLQATEVLLFMHAVLPPLVTALNARQARHDGGGGVWALLRPLRGACAGGEETFDSTNHRLEPRDTLESQGTASGVSAEYVGHVGPPPANAATPRGPTPLGGPGVLGVAQVSARAGSEHLAKRDRATNRARRTVPLRRLAARLGPEPDLADLYSHLVNVQHTLQT